MQRLAEQQSTAVLIIWVVVLMKGPRTLSGLETRSWLAQPLGDDFSIKLEGREDCNSHRRLPLPRSNMLAHALLPIAAAVGLAFAQGHQPDRDFTIPRPAPRPNRDPKDTNDLRLVGKRFEFDELPYKVDTAETARGIQVGSFSQLSGYPNFY